MYSSNDRAQELANATATPIPVDETPTPETDPQGDDGSAGVDDPAADDGAADDPAVETPPPAPGWVVVEGVDERLNIRSGPGTENAVVTQAELGDTLRTTGRSEQVGDGTWIEVEIEDGTGWVFATFTAPTQQPTPTPLATPSPLATPTPSIEDGALIVDAPLGLNLRAEPSADGALIKTIDDGTVVLPTGRTEVDDDDVEWTEIVEGDDTGWAASSFLTTP